MEKGLILGWLLLASCIYALLLQYSERKWRLVSRRTWLVVLIGTSMVLVALFFLIDWDAWKLVLAAFIVAGTPVIGRSILNEIAREVALEERINDRP